MSLKQTQNTNSEETDYFSLARPSKVKDDDTCNPESPWLGVLPREMQASVRAHGQDGRAVLGGHNWKRSN